MSQASLFFDIEEEDIVTDKISEIIVNDNDINNDVNSSKSIVSSFFDIEEDDIWNKRFFDSETNIEIILQIIPILCEMLPINIMCNMCLCNKSLREFNCKVFYQTNITTYQLDNYLLNNRIIYFHGMCSYIQSLLIVSVNTVEENIQIINKINVLIDTNPDLWKMFYELEYDNHNPSQLDMIEKDDIIQQDVIDNHILIIFGKFKDIVNSSNILSYIYRMSEERQQMLLRLSDLFIKFCMKKIEKIPNNRIFIFNNRRFNYKDTQYFLTVYNVITMAIDNFYYIILSNIIEKYYTYLIKAPDMIGMIMDHYKTVFSIEYFDTINIYQMKFEMKTFALPLTCGIYDYNIDHYNILGNETTTYKYFLELIKNLLYYKTNHINRLGFLYIAITNRVIRDIHIESIEKVNWKGILSNLGSKTDVHQLTILLIKLLFERNISFATVPANKHDRYFYVKNEILNVLTFDNYQFLNLKYLRTIFC